MPNPREFYFTRAALMRMARRGLLATTMLLLAIGCSSLDLPRMRVLGSTSEAPESSGSSSSSGAGGNDPTACTLNADCIVVPESCCGSCGAATRGDAIAINKEHGTVEPAEVCPTCPDCDTVWVQDAALIATCESGHCKLVDLHEHSLAACTSDIECRVRTRDCCECSGAVGIESLIAIHESHEPEFMALVCDAQSCDQCSPVYPDEAKAFCNAEGDYCDVAWAFEAG